MNPATERLARRAGCGPLDGPGPCSNDDHAEVQVTHIGYGVYRADLRRGSLTAMAWGYGATAAEARGYVQLERLRRAR